MCLAASLHVKPVSLLACPHTPFSVCWLCAAVRGLGHFSHAPVSHKHMSHLKRRYFRYYHYLYVFSERPVGNPRVQLHSVHFYARDVYPAADPAEPSRVTQIFGCRLVPAGNCWAGLVVDFHGWRRGQRVATVTEKRGRVGNDRRREIEEKQSRCVRRL